MAKAAFRVVLGALSAFVLALVGVVAVTGTAIPGWADRITTAESPITVVDQWTGFDTATDTYDGVHPNGVGDQKMADEWFPALAAALGGARSPAQTPAQAGLRVDGTRIVESTGSPFVIRGVSHPHVWYASETDSFAEIKSFGTNTVRVVLGSGQRWGPSTDVANVVSRCKENRLICVLEVHDTTGFGEESAAASLDEAVDYWISQQEALAGQEDYVVINIGNEPFGNDEQVSATWATATSNAINRLRDNGFHHLIMADAPMWGQDWAGVMRDNAATVFSADPDRNTVFSVHMYGVYDTAETINDYLDSFSDAGLPLVIGEFGHNHSDGDPDEDTIMTQARSRGVGYIGWSYSGNSGGVEYLDLVENFDPASLTEWGERFFNGPDGIAQTSREADVYTVK